MAPHVRRAAAVAVQERFIFAAYAHCLGSHVQYPRGLAVPRNLPGCFRGSGMAISRVENFLRTAKHQVSQVDINESLFKAIDEFIREVKSAREEVQRARRDIQVIRRRY